MGRRTILNERMIVIFERALENGNSMRAACQLAGVSTSTYHNWMNRGEALRDSDEEIPENEQIFLQFLERIEEAKAARELYLVSLVERHAEENWQAAKFLLAAHNPEHFGARKEIRHTGPDGGPVKVVDLTGVSSEALRAAFGADEEEPPNYTGVNVPNREELV